MIRKFTGSAQELAAIRTVFNATAVDQSDLSFERWTGYYLQYTPDWIYLAGPPGEIWGYLMGAPDSAAARPFFRDRIRSYEIFQDLFDEYPAHLHINLLEAARGQGLGAQLIGRLRADLGAVGVHVVTSPDQANVGFYRRQGFKYEQRRPFKSHVLLFMGASPLYPNP